MLRRRIIACIPVYFGRFRIHANNESIKYMLKLNIIKYSLRIENLHLGICVRQAVPYFTSVVISRLVKLPSFTSESTQRKLYSACTKK